MTTETDLLPLPEKEQLANPYAHSFGSVTAYGHTDDTLRDYARANVAHATAPLQAEIKALRAEVERLREIVRPKREDECLTLDHWRMRAYYLEANWSRCSHACAGEQAKREQAEARAERLAEAGRRVTAAFRAHGKADWMDRNSTRDECEAAMLALDAALEEVERWRRFLRG